MNKLNFLLLLSIIFLFAACEYEPNGTNFVELTPPEDSIQIEILLNDVTPSDTIYIYQYTSIALKINAQKELQQAVLLLDGQEYLNIWGNSASFEINPDQLNEGLHELTLNSIFSTGTGSLAEMMGLEGYVGELSWNLCVIQNPQDKFTVEYRLNEEGFLELFWDNAIPEKYIEKYTLTGLTLNTGVTFNDATQKSFVDYGYVCGNGNYMVSTYFKDGNIFWKTLSISTPTPTVYFEDLGLDSLRVYWDKPFASGRFDLFEDDILKYSDILDTSIIIPQLFGKTRQFMLEAKPRKAEYDNFHNSFVIYKNFCQGISLGLPNWPLYAFNTTDNIIYTSRYNDLVAYDATSMEEINIVSIPGNTLGLIYGGKISSAPHNSTIAAMTGEETWIFSNSSFNNSIIISPLRGDVNTRLSALTSNDRFFVVEKDSSNCKIFNSLTGEKIFEFPFTYKTNYTFPDFVTVSEDGQFFCASSIYGMEVFKIDETVTNLIYTDTRYYKGAMFVPSQPDYILLRVDTDIELRQLPDFNLVQTLDVSENGAVLCNIDPASKNLLYYQNDSLKVCKINNITETLFKIRSDETTCKMLNNKLLTYGKGGIYFDLNPYIVK